MIWRICWANLLGIVTRWDSSLVLVSSVAAVTCVFCFTLTMSVSLNSVMQNTSRDGWAIAVRQGADAESLSVISLDEVGALRSMLGQDIEVQLHRVVPTMLARTTDPEMTGSVVIRGLSKPETLGKALVSGRWPTDGKYEVAVGHLAAGEYQGLKAGEFLQVQGISWQIVGVFRSQTSADSEILAPLHSVANAYSGTRFSSIRIKVEQPVLGDIQRQVESNPQLRLHVVPESEFFVVPESASIIGFVGRLVTVIMAMGALVAAISVMFTAVEERSREIGILRAIGFSAFVIAFSIAIEAVFLCIVGTLIGLNVAAIVFGGTTFTTGSLVSISSSLDITLPIVLNCLAGGVALGVFGSLLPMWKGVRMEIAECVSIAD